MLYAGCDLHKQTISICVIDQSRTVVHRKKLPCNDPNAIREFFASLGEFQAVVEATAGYEWFLKILGGVAGVGAVLGETPVPGRRTGSCGVTHF